MNKILVLGDGLLGSEIIKQTGWLCVSRKSHDIDFTNLYSYAKYLGSFDVIVNCIGFTDTYDEDFEKHWNVNYKGVVELVDWINGQNRKLVHISTDYIYSNSKTNATEENPPANCPNWYTYSKLLADGYVQLRLSNYLLIRTSFKPKPFPYPEAINQFGNFDYVDVIADLIIQLINKNALGIYNVGTAYKSMEQLGRETNKNVITTNKKIHPTMPQDISMNVEKMEKFLNE